MLLPSSSCYVGRLLIGLVTFGIPEKFENVANPDFENLKHLQNPGHLSMTAPSIHKVKLRCRQFTEFEHNVYDSVVASLLGGPTQHFWRKTLVSTLRFFLRLPEF